MDELAKKLINDHRNPIVKVDLPGSKFTLKSSTTEQAKFIEKHQSNLENLLRHDRAERRCGRSQANWMSNTNLAKVTKVVKTILNHFGYQDKSGIFLYPEETLFLMETNRLEVIHNDVPLSIQEGYNLISLDGECNLTKYRVYKKLVLLGYKLLRYSEVLRRQSKNKRKTDKETINSVVESDNVQPTVKRCLEEGEFTEGLKKIRAGIGIENCKDLTETDIVESGSGCKKNDLQVEFIKNLFENLRQTAPRGYGSNTTDEEVPDFCVFLPHNRSRCDFDFNLYVCKEIILQRKLPHKSVPSVYAICADDNISFYRFTDVNLPFL